MNTIELTFEQWLEEGIKRYGNNMSTWRYTCPMCKKDTVAQEWIDHNVKKQIAISCIGRQYDQKQSAFFTKNKKPTGCDYAGYGLFRMNPVNVEFTNEDGSKEIVGGFDFAVKPLLESEKNNES